MKNRKKHGSKSLIVKSLSFAAIAGLTLFGIQADAESIEALNRQTGDRTYEFESADDVYTVTQNFGSTGNGTIAITGKVDGDNKSTIDLNSHSGFNNLKTVTITLKDLIIKNASGSYDGIVIGTESNSGYSFQTDNADFINNIGTTATEHANGGALMNWAGNASIKDAIFMGNGAVNTKNKQAEGGAYCGWRASTTEEISGTFIGNYAKTISDNANGGAIYVNGTVTGDISGIFDSNYVESNSGGVYGSAIYIGENSAHNINAQFTNNKSISNTGDTSGAIANIGATINSLKGYFEGNYATSQGRASAGAINNNGNSVITEGVEANFVNNYAKSTGTSALARAGAILNFGYISSLKGDFTENYAKSSGTGAIGGAIAVMHSSTNTLEAEGIDIIQGNYTGNYAIATGDNGYAHGGAIYNTGILGEIVSSNFEGNYAQAEQGEAKGGAIYNTNTIENILNSTFKNNYVVALNSEAKGGAIYTEADMTLTAKDNFEFEISGNYVEDKNGKRDEGIYVENNATFTLQAQTNGKFNLKDKINGTKGYTLKTAGDKTGVVNINNDILNANIDHNDVTTYVNGMKYLNQPEALNSLTMNSGTLNIGSLALAPLHFDTFSINGGTINIDSVDVDLANKTMGRITANNYNESKGGTVNVKAMNILSDAKDLITPVKFADKSFKNTVKTDVKEAYTPLYKYDVEYDTNRQYSQEDDDGYFIFKRYKKVTPQPKPQPQPQPQPDKPEYNPAVLATPVATQAAGQATIHQTFQYVFEHADAFMQLPSIDRFAKIHDNEYALSTDYNNNLGELDVSKMNKGVWVRPYTSFDRTDLKNGPKVDSVNYGTIIGADTEFRKLRNGWSNVGTGYIGYFGSQIDFSDVDTSMNGGLLGLTETFYKGNFFTALTASVGAGVAESHTMYGKDDITMLMAGIASKTGYNFEFKEGKFIIQPILMVDYTMINTFDYTNAAGVKIDADPMHTIQINPTVRFIGNLKDGWQPYASVGMVWNLMNETSVSANGVDLPSMHTKPYVEYGAGLQRTWDDKFTAFGQAMVRNGGRTGIAFTAGFRWALGDEPKARSVDASPVQRKESVKKTNSKKRMSLRASQKLDCFVAEPSALRNDMQKTVVKSRKTAPKSRNLARYQALISE